MYSPEILTYTATQEDPDWSDMGGFSGINLCTVCGVDMGDCNSRQLCGKLVCDDQERIDREKYHRNKLQCKVKIVSRLMGCYRRAGKTAYAPGGSGFLKCKKRFDSLKSDDTEEQTTKRIKKE